MMAQVRAWIARFRWIGWIVLAAAVAALTLVVRRMFAGTSPQELARFQMPAVPPLVQQQVQVAEEHATVTRIQASTQADVKKDELTQVLQIPNGADGGAERRRRLAAMLRDMN